MFKQLIQNSFSESIATKERALLALADKLQAAAELCVNTFQGGGKIIFCGNGGSAADAQHLAAEFVGRFLLDRRPLPALALNVNTSSLTSIGNDYGYRFSFSRQVEAFAQAGDLLVGISTSGNSGNVLEAVLSARKLGMRIIAMTGEGGGQLAAHADVLLDVPSQSTPRIQECHVLLGHILCQAVDEVLGTGEVVKGLRKHSAGGQDDREGS